MAPREAPAYGGSLYDSLAQDKGTGLGKPLKIINHLVKEDIPIAIASLGPKSVETTAEIADAWLPAFYTPEAADAVWGNH